MKKIYSTILFISTIHFGLANEAINSVPTTGYWKNPSTWSLGRVPMNGDTVIISAGNTVMIDDIENLGTQLLYVNIYGTLVFSNGKLWINGSSSVYIFAGGSVTSTGSPSETLKIGGVNKYVGTDGTISGPLFANQTTSASPLGFISAIALPVRFVGLNLARQNTDVLVQWEAVEEMNSSHYEIERSENGSDWSSITHINARENAAARQSYSYSDRNASAKLLYYRVRQVDVDGKCAFSPVRSIKNENGHMDIRNNVISSNSVYLHFSEQAKGNVIVRITYSNGRIISQKTFGQPVGQVIVPIQNAARGIYFITVADGKNLKFSKEILL